MKVEFTEKSKKQFLKLDKPIKLQEYENPRVTGKALVGNYRLICRIRDDKLVIIVVDVGHKKDIYDE